MPRRTDRRRVVALAATLLAAVVTAVATGAALAGETPRDEAQAWRTAFDRRVQVPLGKRMIVVLAAPSLADRVAADRAPAVRPGAAQARAAAPTRCSGDCWRRCARAASGSSVRRSSHER